MSKPFSLKYKICYQNKLNFWGSTKILNFKRKKWNSIKFRKKEVNFSPIFFSGKINLRHFFKNILFLKRFLRYYSCRISSSQLKKIFRLSKGKTLRFIHFLNILESRLDVVLFRAGFFSTVFEARQFILHKNILLNGQLVNNPGHFLKPYDLVKIKKSTSVDKKIAEGDFRFNILSQGRKFSHLEVNFNTLSIIYLGSFSKQNLPFASIEGYHFLDYLYY